MIHIEVFVILFTMSRLGVALDLDNMVVDVFVVVGDNATYMEVVDRTN